MSATTPFHVTVASVSVGQSPTYEGMWAIANIFSACGIGHTVHTPATYAHMQRQNAAWTPMSDTEWDRFKANSGHMGDMWPPEPYPWMTDDEIQRQNERRAVEIWES